MARHRRHASRNGCHSHIPFRACSMLTARTSLTSQSPPPSMHCPHVRACFAQTAVPTTHGYCRPSQHTYERHLCIGRHACIARRICVLCQRGAVRHTHQRAHHVRAMAIGVLCVSKGTVVPVSSCRFHVVWGWGWGWGWGMRAKRESDTGRRDGAHVSGTELAALHQQGPAPAQPRGALPSHPSAHHSAIPPWQHPPEFILLSPATHHSTLAAPTWLDPHCTHLILRCVAESKVLYPSWILT